MLGDPLFLTPLLRAGKIKEAQQAAYVSGAGIDKIARSYAGYLTVNEEECGSNLFFWFFASKVKHRIILV